jgi:nicotinate-nucleotide pyrophosphorylase (carboxylating)
MHNTLQVLLLSALSEDGAQADLTTLGTVPAGQQASGTILTRQAGVVAGLAVAAETFRLFDPQVEVKLLVEDGARVGAEQPLMHLRAAARSLLSAERVALNFLGRLSGIATLTARCVHAVAGTGVYILDTRKTTPGLRTLEREAVRLGGGQNHRFGLNDGVLIKDNHIKAAGGIARAIENARRQVPHLHKIEIECETLVEVEQAVQAGAEVILLDNMSTERLREAVAFVRRIAPQTLLEASGGIGTDPDRLAAVASTGVDFISLGALTHSAPGFDVSLEFA